MDRIKFAQKLQVVFGYNFVGDYIPGEGTLDGRNVALVSVLKCATYIPVINFIAIGIISHFLKSELIKEPVGRAILARLMISAFAAPILLPIDIIATVALRVFITCERKRLAALSSD